MLVQVAVQTPVVTTLHRFVCVQHLPISTCFKNTALVKDMGRYGLVRFAYGFSRFGIHENHICVAQSVSGRLYSEARPCAKLRVTHLNAKEMGFNA